LDINLKKNCQNSHEPYTQTRMKIYFRKKTFGVVLCGQPISDRIYRINRMHNEVYLAMEFLNTPNVFPKGIP